ncbi:MAG: GNAT family N-acetyltransferase [Bacilli bacterium]|nr:GNAT family N-acetyltransferase [Bacilli bacterium]
MIEVRKATLEDAKIMGEIHYYTWLSTYARLIDEGFLKSRSLQKSIDMFRQMECKNHLVLTLDNQVVGLIGYGPSREESLPDYGEIIGLYVLKAYQKQGFGKTLLEHALEELRNMGYYKLFLWVLAENQQAIRFYEANGFYHDGETKQLLLGKPVLEKRYQRKESYGTNN